MSQPGSRCARCTPSMGCGACLSLHPREMSPELIDVAELPRGVPKLGWQCSRATMTCCGAWPGLHRGPFNDLVQRIALRRLTDRSTRMSSWGFRRSEAQFENSMRLVAGRGLIWCTLRPTHRPGTVSATWRRLPTKKGAAAWPSRRCRSRSLARSTANCWATVEVLVDGRQRGRWRGRTRTNKLVFFASDDDWLGRMALVRLGGLAWSMLGRVLGPAPGYAG